MKMDDELLSLEQTTPEEEEMIYLLGKAQS